MKKIYLTFATIVLFAIGFAASDKDESSDNSSTGSKPQTEQKQETEAEYKLQIEETNDNIETQYEENSMVENEYEEDFNSNRNVDISPILYECQEEITSCQREIESLCRTFATLASDNDIDMMKYGQMKITFINGVNGWTDKANMAFDKCSRDLQQAGVNDAVSAVNEEKRQFNLAINELKSKTIQQVEMSY